MEPPGTQPDSLGAQETRRKGHRRLKRMLLAAVAVVGLWLIVGAAAAWKVTRRPHPPFSQPSPTVAGKLMEQHRLRTSDGEEIGAWFLPAQPGR